MGTSDRGYGKTPPTFARMRLVGAKWWLTCPAAKNLGYDLPKPPRGEPLTCPLHGDARFLTLATVALLLPAPTRSVSKPSDFSTRPMASARTEVPMKPSIRT